MEQPPTTDHIADARIAEGARLILETPVERRPSATVPWLGLMLGLSPQDAVLAIREAQLRRSLAYSGGADERAP